MYLEVYPDIIFILNFVINFILLFLLKRVNRKKSSVLRLFMASAAGALISAVCGAFPYMNVLLRIIVMGVAALVLMIFIAFGRMKLTDFLKQMIAFGLITYFVGGLMNSVYYYTNLRLFLLKLGNGLVFSNISWKFVIAVIVVLLPVLLFLLWLFRWYHKDTREICKVELILGERSITCDGLLDSGNCLYDPIFNRPVMVIENSLAEELLSPELLKDLENVKNSMEGKRYDAGQWDISNEHILRLRFIPYQSIGKANGMMIGFVLDKVLIHTNKETICNEKVTAAVCDNRLSANEDYQVILHKELL